MQTWQFIRNLLIPKTWQHWLILFILALFITLAIAFQDFYTPLINLTVQGKFTILIIIITFTLNAATRISSEIIFLGALGILFLGGVLDEKTALKGFSNGGLITVAVLYIVVAGLQQTGTLGWISQQVLGLPKTQTGALFRLMFPIMGLSAFLNNTPVVAMFIPVVREWCRKLRISPSKLMIPVSYGAIFGGMCTLIGTSTNLVVNGLLVEQTDYSGMGLFDITKVGLPCAIAGATVILWGHPWLLPDRKPAIDTTDDQRQYTVEFIVTESSPLAGKTVEKAGLRHLPGLFLAEIQRGGQILPAVSSQEVLQEKDQLIFVGIVDSIIDLHRLRGIQPATDQVFKLDTPRTERCLVEAVVSHTCPLVEKTIREGKFRSQYNAVVLAVARNGERLKGKIGDIVLRSGDSLLLEAHSTFLDQQRMSQDFYLVSGIPNTEPIRHDKAPLAIAVLVIMVTLASFSGFGMLKAAILASIIMLITKCCSPQQAMGNIEWSVLVVIGSALGLGEALQSTGGAEAIASTFIGFTGNNPWLALVVVYGITSFLTEIITNNAAAAIMFSIALSLSKNLDVNFMPFVIAIMIGASASFATPIGYQTNMMVYGPGSYKFTDFFRAGIPLNLLFWLIAVSITPIFYPF
jgi:di/tricarboxylate transporter